MSTPKKKIDQQAYLESGAYLPAPLRDFHGAKDVFKTLHGTVAVDKNEYVRGLSWITGHIYVVDIFLWFMARRGWTLQRSRANVDFRDLEADVKSYRASQSALLIDIFAKRKAEKATPTTLA